MSEEKVFEFRGRHDALYEIGFRCLCFILVLLVITSVPFYFLTLTYYHPFTALDKMLEWQIKIKRERGWEWL